MIHFVHGTMMSGKTANAIMLKQSLDRLEKKVFMFKISPIFLGAEGISIKSRTGLSTNCLKVGRNFDFKQFFISNYNENVIMIIDECQFLSLEQLEYLSEVSYPVYMYGIRFDYKGNLFEPIPIISANAETCYELPSICFAKNCRDKSTHHLLFINEKLVKEDVAYDPSQKREYKSVCKHHFKYNTFN